MRYALITGFGLFVAVAILLSISLYNASSELDISAATYAGKFMSDGSYNKCVFESAAKLPATGEDYSKISEALCQPEKRRRQKY